MKLMSPLLLDLWLLSNMAPGTDLSGILETPTMLSARCHDPGSARVLGDAWLGAGGSYSSPHRRANLVCTLARSQLLYRVRLEAVVQSRDLSRQGIDEHLGRMELPPGGVRITDGPKCAPQLV